MGVDEAIEQFKSALHAFAQGDAEPVKSLYSHGEDATLANPFGPAVRGWTDVSAALDYASSRFSDGEVIEFQAVARYESADLVTVFDIERWRARVGGGDLADFELRVTTTYRSEEDGWKIAHRHADPIATRDERGPLRQA